MNIDEADEMETESSREPSFRNMFYKYRNKITAVIISLIVVFYIYYQVGLGSNDDHSFTSKFVYNIFAIVIPVIGILCFILLSTIDKEFGMYMIIGTIFAISIFGMVFYFLQTTLSQYIFNKYLLYFVVICGFIIALSIVATLLSGTLRRQVGWTGFLSNLLFYIPCLIRDGIQGAIKEYNTFSTTLLILFGIEILFLLMYFFLIPLFNKNSVPENISLLEDPIMLNTAMPLSVAPIYTGTGPWNNFAISMWIYVNPGPNTKVGYTQQTPIFSYSPGSSDNYFTLNYINDPGKETLFNLDISNTTVTNVFGSVTNPIPFTMPLQKWNNIVFNVVTDVTTTIDVFLNGELIQSCPLENIPNFSPTDALKVGSGTIDANIDGLYGAICNIVYYQKPLSRLSIIYNYNKLVVNNPPV